MKEVLCFFSFSRHASDHMMQMCVSLDDLIHSAAFERARVRGCERVISGIKTGDVKMPHHILSERHADMEMLSYLFARILVSCIGDDHLARRYARGEAKSAYEKLVSIASSRTDTASLDTDSLLQALADDLGVKMMPSCAHPRADGDAEHRMSGTRAAIADDIRMYLMHFTDYLRLASGLKEPKWRLVNRILHKGFVLISGNELLRLFQEAFYERVKERLPAEVTRDICDAVRKYTSEIRRVWSAWLSARGGNVITDAHDQSAFPPCISYVLKCLLGGEEISHSARFALTSFLLNIGMRTDDIIRMYENAPDFDLEKTRYQIEHIAGSRGTRYTAPSCKTMRTYGICVDNDELCEKVSHPLDYYALASARKSRASAAQRGEQ